MSAQLLARGSVRAPVDGGVRHGATRSSLGSGVAERGDVRPGRSLAANQSGDGLPRCVPHSRDSASIDFLSPLADNASIALTELYRGFRLPMGAGSILS